MIAGTVPSWFGHGRSPLAAGGLARAPAAAATVLQPLTPCWGRAPAHWPSLAYPRQHQHHQRGRASVVAHAGKARLVYPCSKCGFQHTRWVGESEGLTRSFPLG